MSRFYGSMIGSKGEVTQQGTLSSGIYAHTRGCVIGASVSCSVGSDGEDRITIHLTSGSNRGNHERYIGTFKLKGSRIVKIKE